MLVDLIVGPGLPHGCILMCHSAGRTVPGLPFARATNPPSAAAVMPGLNRGVPADTWDWFRSQTTPILLAQFTEVARYSS
jgi:hypothetical protein